MLDTHQPAKIAEDTSAILIDPIFYPPPQCFRYAPPAHTSDLGDWLAQQISRQPRRLQLHVQRIVWHAEQGSAEQLGGALVDLFIALGDAGSALRTRLLRASRRRLPAPLQSFLEDYLHQPLSAATPLPLPLPWSRLSLGISGISELIHRERHNVTEHAPLDLAQTLLEEGNIDDAAALLEQALQKSPDHHAMQSELLDICRATRDSGPLRRLQHDLRMDAPMRQDWDNTLTWLEAQETAL